ncbi:GLPGLI family protein [Elizabethkingia meningoseptica]|uniref:GLPGLI family protein n=1 Tax=Elizabethkingia meningoseptica TaxID=238 RepID=UPI003891928E
MNRLLQCLMVFIATIALAQTNRFIYELRYKLDSTKNEYKTKEVVLDINPDNVKFYEYGFLPADSLNRLHGNMSNKYTSQAEQTLIRNKNSFQNNNYLQIWMMPYYYHIKTKDEMSWNISDQIKTENGFKMQKATTHFGGRNWIAWFTPDIPISEGPYKFRGLPGLILKIEDDKQNFIYTFSRNKNLPTTFSTEQFVENHYNMKPITITFPVWVKLKKEFYNDPYARMRAEFQPDWDVEINKRKIKNKEEFYELTPDMQKSIREYYANPVELDKAIKY